MAANNKTVLITGATRGIGLELATFYTKNGWNVIGAARNLDKSEKLQAVSPYKIVQIDTGNEASILAAAKALEGEKIDLLINNAGIGEFDNFESATKESLLRQFEIDAVGPFLVTRAFVPHLRAAAAKNEVALVIQMGSIMGSIQMNDPKIVGGTGLYGYHTAKAALNMVNSCLALDLKKDNIVSVSLHPGYVNTDLTQHKADINTDESVAGMANVIAGLKVEDTGKFFNYDGSALPW